MFQTDAVLALKTLGFTKDVARRAVGDALEHDAPSDLESLVKAALQSSAIAARAAATCLGAAPFRSRAEASLLGQLDALREELLHPVIEPGLRRNERGRRASR